MTKEEILQELAVKVNNGEISRTEVLARLPMDTTTKTSPFSVTKMLYVMGAAIVLIGIVIFVGQIWEDLGLFGRIIITFGLGIFLAAIGSFLYKQKQEDTLGSVFHFLGGMLIPGGAAVTLSEFEVESDTAIALTYAMITVFYVVLNVIHKKDVLTFFAVANATVTAYLVLNAIVDGPFEGWFGIRDIYQYLTIATGASYLLLAHAFREGWNNKLLGALYLFGSAGLLGAAFSLVFDSVLWQMFYFVLVIGGLFLSVYMKSRIVLVMSTLFLIAHVSYITGEYFADSLGWPISLVVLGFVFIGLGYVSVTISKKYISS